MAQNDKDYYYASIVQRLDMRVKTVSDKADRVKKNYLESKKFVDHESEANRIWLDQFTGGVGFDIACGDFLIGDIVQAIGVDGASYALGTDWHCEGDNLKFQEDNTLDYVVTNYLDGMSSPLRALTEWCRVVKPGGKVAVVVRDADTYNDACGPIGNVRRQCCFTLKTLGFYMNRVGLKNVTVEKYPKTNNLRSVGTV